MTCGNRVSNVHTRRPLRRDNGQAVRDAEPSRARTIYLAVDIANSTSASLVTLNAAHLA